MQEFQSHVSFSCPICGKPSSGYVTIPEPDWGAAESSNELYSEDQIWLQSTGCEHGFDAHCINNAGLVNITISEFPDARVDADQAYFSEEWPEPELPTDPRSIFEEFQGEAKDWLEKHGNPHGGALINRMLFASVISGLEAYLSDTLIKAVSGRRDAQLGLVEKDRAMSEKFTLAQIIKNPDLVTHEIRKYLGAVSFHKLPRANFLYSAALKIDFFALMEGDEVAALNTAIKHRHHVVHRNGRDEEGNLLEVFTPDYVMSILNLATKLIRMLDERVNPDSYVDDSQIPY